ncbi:MAG: 4Fe-4S binding protein [Merdibacter sp.]
MIWGELRSNGNSSRLRWNTVLNGFVIQDAHCLHCGLCQERCPMQAIKKRGEER